MPYLAVEYVRYAQQKNSPRNRATKLSWLVETPKKNLGKKWRQWPISWQDPRASVGFVMQIRALAGSILSSL